MHYVIMRLVDQFHKEGIIDAYTFVFDDINPDGMNTMLALSEDGYTFSQWATGLYDPEGENEHLGQRVFLSAIGTWALDGFFSRLSSPRERAEISDVAKRIIREDGDE